ncbi:MAG: CHAT domain-containing protein, partial [Methylocella sp.]
VISARWPVSAAVSLQIVHEFYNSLNTPGISVAKALQTAQLNMLKKPHYQRHTYYWAPFSLLGDWY